MELSGQAQEVHNLELQVVEEHMPVQRSVEVVSLQVAVYMFLLLEL